MQLVGGVVHVIKLAVVVLIVETKYPEYINAIDVPVVQKLNQACHYELVIQIKQARTKLINNVINQIKENNLQQDVLKRQENEKFRIIKSFRLSFLSIELVLNYYSIQIEVNKNKIYHFQNWYRICDQFYKK
ncbi:unnamed protein product [Paramecium pentaurelia]|uniref:Transmembrane protein n=1 Tax=Paramecium pentaurelia TaxID=43138 RepID=A0A8S1VXN0_9CILI|nr:unnamed protein product [Paramecium pentaurelia]